MAIIVKAGRRIGFGLLLIGVLALGAVPRPAEATDAAAFIRGLAEKAIPVLTNRSLPQATREQRFRELMHEGFDIRQIGQLVLGRYWNQASQPERQEFVRLLEDYLVRLYAARFTDYPGVTLRVEGARPDTTGTLVHTVLLRPDGPPVQVDWRVEQDGGRPVITDIMIEGVSMVITQRSEFASVIRQKGGQVDGLLQVLREKTQG